MIVHKSLEVLARITIPVAGENSRPRSAASLSGLSNPVWGTGAVPSEGVFPLTESSIEYGLEVLDERRQLKSRDREVFAALVQLHAYNDSLMLNLADILTYMCKLQPPEFVLLSFSVELDRFLRVKQSLRSENGVNGSQSSRAHSKELKFASAFVQHISTWEILYVCLISGVLSAHHFFLLA
jgi:hypothetical protein